MTARRLRGGLIGCGAIGKIFSEAIAGIEGMDLVAFCSRDLAKAEQFRATFGGEYSSSDAERLIGDPTLDAIYITAWHDSHADLAIRSARAGKHVMVKGEVGIGECWSPTPTSTWCLSSPWCRG